MRALMASAGCDALYIAAIDCRMHGPNPATLKGLLVGYLFSLAGLTLLFLSALEIPLHIPKVLTYLGKISYGLYVYHWFLIAIFASAHRVGWQRFTGMHVYLGIPLALAGTVLVASMSYRFFEQPILRMKSRFEIIHTRELVPSPAPALLSSTPHSP